LSESYEDQLAKERREHPTLPDATIRQIVADHTAAGVTEQTSPLNTPEHALENGPPIRVRKSEV